MDFDELFDTLIERMVKASGQTRDDILSDKRAYPLPVCRWAIGDKLMKAGYTSTKVSNALGLNHATLYYGRNKIAMMKSKLGWTLELEILTRFETLCR